MRPVEWGPTFTTRFDTGSVIMPRPILIDYLQRKVYFVKGKGIIIISLKSAHSLAADIGKF